MKKDADLEVARKLFELDEIMNTAISKHETPSLKHVLSAKGGQNMILNIELKITRFFIHLIKMEIQ